MAERGVVRVSPAKRSASRVTLYDKSRIGADWAFAFHDCRQNKGVHVLDGIEMIGSAG